MFLGGAFSRNLYFRVQTGTTTYLFNRGFSCLCLLGGAFSRNLYFGYKQTPKQTYLFFHVFEWCLKSNIVLPCTNRHHNKPIKQGI